ncbi:hypothetical protein CC85DRAFT_284026 [Cutaneotrichosporon oleaginosum]|uniref:Uncharacterized protein n=1 Tax=Cutaneotrichosporon oleaginosum TaxID=879819 RepID=A0A0J0XSD5_9TREE|nr:uncharacterized protein CC85DRAFT_284026 [Cutaneotrichosporon oleaginosum]KLT43986.1 hypothetical protein CC85DRAFT_284026 [Cutaneotrichosporon oleaginosum]TXT04067.1 hypothetical protein COLE_07764 [Cutaneotrichosporon oleaginosum]
MLHSTLWSSGSPARQACGARGLSLGRQDPDRAARRKGQGAYRDDHLLALHAAFYLLQVSTSTGGVWLWRDTLLWH